MVKLLKKDLALGLEFLASIFTELDAIADANFLKTKNSIAQEIIGNTEKISRKLSYYCYEMLYPGHRMSIPNTGTISDIEKLTIKNVIEFNHTFYTKANFVLVVSGNVIPEKVLKLAEKYFGRETRCTKPSLSMRNRHPNPALSKQTSGLGTAKSLTIKPTAAYKLTNDSDKRYKQAHLKIDFPGVIYKDEASYGLNLLSLILKSRLLKNISAKNFSGKTIECINFCSGTFGIFSVYSQLQRKNVTDFVKLLKTATSYIPNIDSKELQYAKNVYAAQLTYALDKNSARAEYYSNAILHGSEKQQHKFEFETIKELTKKDIAQSSQRLFRKKPKVTLLSNKPISTTEKKNLKITLLS
jgi:predicted Zn-dependent peptidase